MKIAIRFSAKQELKALPIMLRHSPGMVLPGRVYILQADAVQALRDQGIKFTELSREADAPTVGGIISGERI